MRWQILAMLAVAAIIHQCGSCSSPEPQRWRLATFNIEDFPKHARQVEAAFAEMASFDAGIIAVQEITDTALFATTARARLGEAWKFVATAAPRDRDHHLGVLFDGRAYSHVSTRIHDGTRLAGRHKPTLDVELRPKDADETIRVLVVHFKSGGENHPVRRRQYTALAAIVREVKAVNPRVILVGDFNATGEADRRDLAKLAELTSTTWASEDLACSAFWSRADGCARSRLDHAITTLAPSDVTAAGACATEGCDWQERCPIYFEEVSDHCPVVLTFAR